MKMIGKTVEFITFGGITQVAVIKSVEFDQNLGRPMFTGINKYNNRVKFTMDEIYNIYK